MGVTSVASAGNIAGRPDVGPGRRRVRGVIAACVASLALAACRDEARPGSDARAGTFAIGTPIGASAQAEIGASGGTLELGDVAITVPPGAVDTTTTFRISEISRTAPHGDAPAYRLEPHGARFAVPVEIRFSLDADGAGARFAVYQDDAGHWIGAPESSYDAATHSLRVATTHFSDWTYAESFVLEASSYSVRTGGSVDLVVKNCYARGFLDDEGYEVPALVSTCEPVAGEAFLDGESVNGEPGGSAAHGTVARQGGALRYTAPATVPDSNPVAISVQVEDIGRDTLLLLLANVTVVDDVAYRGTTVASDGSFSAEVSWAEDASFGEEIRYVPSGTVTTVVPGCTVSPSAGEISPDDGYLEIDYSQSPPRYYGSAFSSWDVTVTCGASSYTTTISAQWFESGGTQYASSDGRTLEGSTVVGSWSFSRTP